MMIFFHSDGLVTEIMTQAGDECYVELAGQSLGNAWKEVLDRGYEGWLGWCDAYYKAAVQVETWESLLNHPLELISYEPNEENRFAPDLGYVLFESPCLINYPMDKRYPTWQVSSIAGCIHSKVLFQRRKILTQDISVNFILNAISFSGYKHGLITYSEPALFKGVSEKYFLQKKNSTLSIFEKLYFLRSFGTVRQFFFYFLLLAGYEHRFPLVTFFRAILRSKYQALVDLPIQLSPRAANPAVDTVDVLIPTLGRAFYLKDVIEDLAAQTHLPQSVIIIEQLMEEESASNLSFLDQTDWPFEVLHIITRQLGACHARNLGLKEVKSRWVFLADDDIRLTPETIATTLGRLSTYHTNAATIAVFQKNEDCAKRQPIMWDTFGTGTSIIKSNLLEDSSFDLALEFGYGEDKDYGIQLRRKGTAVIYVTDCPILHLKAPIGGFRQKVNKPWDDEQLLPKPSPTVLYYIQKNHSIFQQKGYKFYFLTRQIFTKGFFSMKKILDSWKISEYWVSKLKQA